MPKWTTKTRKAKPGSGDFDSVSVYKDGKIMHIGNPASVGRWMLQNIPKGEEVKENPAHAMLTIDDVLAEMREAGLVSEAGQVEAFYDQPQDVREILSLIPNADEDMIKTTIKTMISAVDAAVDVAYNKLHKLEDKKGPKSGMSLYATLRNIVERA